MSVKQNMRIFVYVKQNMRVILNMKWNVKMIQYNKGVIMYIHEVEHEGDNYYTK